MFSRDNVRRKNYAEIAIGFLRVRNKKKKKNNTTGTREEANQKRLCGEPLINYVPI